MKKLIMVIAALAVLAVPAVASAAPVNPVNFLDENLRLEGQFVDVSANAVEGTASSLNCATFDPNDPTTLIGCLADVLSANAPASCQALTPASTLTDVTTCITDLVAALQNPPASCQALTPTSPIGDVLACLLDVLGGQQALLNPFGPVLDSDVRYREETQDPLNATVFDRQQLEWKAQDLRIEDPTDPQAAIDAPDGTQLRTDVYQVQQANLFASGNPNTFLLSDGINLLTFVGTVFDENGTTLLADVQDGEAELKAEFRSQDGGDDIPDISEGECDAIVLVDDATGSASAASVLDDQGAC